MVSSWGERVKSLYSPCHPVFGCGLPWEGSKTLWEENLQPRQFSRELIAEGCLLAAVQQGINHSVRKGIWVAHHSFHSIFFARMLGMVHNGLGDGQNFQQ